MSFLGAWRNLSWSTLSPCNRCRWFGLFRSRVSLPSEIGSDASGSRSSSISSSSSFFPDAFTSLGLVLVKAQGGASGEESRERVVLQLVDDHPVVDGLALRLAVEEQTAQCLSARVAQRFGGELIGSAGNKLRKIEQ